MRGICAPVHAQPQPHVPVRMCAQKCLLTLTPNTHTHTLCTNSLATLGSSKKGRLLQRLEVVGMGGGEADSGPQLSTWEMPRSVPKDELEAEELRHNLPE